MDKEAVGNVAAFTAVFLGVTRDEAKAIVEHPKWSAGSWSHAIYDRDEARAELERARAAADALAPQPSAQQAEPGSPMKAAADALRRKAELEQAHQDGYRDGFKAAQAMLDKAEQPAKKAPTVCNCSGCNALRAKPAEEARGVDGGLMEAIRRYAFLFALHTQNNTDASRAEADAALARIRSLLAAPAAGTGQDAGAGVSNDYQRGYEDGQKDAQAATGAKGLTREDILRIGKGHFRYGVLTDDAAVDFARAVLAASRKGE